MSQIPPPGWRPGPYPQQPAWGGPAAHRPPVTTLPPYGGVPPAPPYPPLPVGPPPSVRPTGWSTSSRSVLGATAVAVALHLVLVLVLNGGALPAGAAGRIGGGMVLPAALVAAVVWRCVRRRALAFWQVLLIVVPAYFALLLLFGALLVGALVFGAR